MDGLTGRERFDNNTDDVVVVNTAERDGDGPLNLAGGDAYLSADFVRQGYDLTLQVDSGQSIVIPGYFSSETAPDLHLSSGAVIPGELATKLAGPMTPGQYAQLQAGPAGLGEPIGSVTDLEGSVTVTRADGTQVTLGSGDSVFQGDVIETGAKSSIGVVFADDTTFSLDADGRMVLDEMVYDPDAQTGVFEATLVKGVFSFVSGQVAKTGPDSMVLHTPNTTIGIRGSTGLVSSGVGGGVGNDGNGSNGIGNSGIGNSGNGNSGVDKVTLVPDIDGTLGELVVFNQGGSRVLNKANASTSVFNPFQQPTEVVLLSPQQIQQDYGRTLTVLVRTEAKKAVVKAQQATQKAEQAQQDAAQQKEDAAKSEEEAAQADQEAANAEADAAAAQAEADAAKAEAEAAKAEAEAAQEADAKAAAEAKLAAAEAKAAEAEAQAAAQAEAAAAKAAAAEAKLAEAAAKAEAAAQAEQQAAEATAAKQAADQFSQMANTAADIQQQVFTQFVQTGVVDTTLLTTTVTPATPTDGTGSQGANGQTDEQAAEDAAVQQAYLEAMAAGATPEEAFNAAAMEATDGNLDDPAVDVARAAFEEAIANGATPQEAMLAAQKAAAAFSMDQQFTGQDPNAPQQPGQFTPNAPQTGPGQGGTNLPSIDPNKSPQENFDAIAQAASGGNMDDPAVAAARNAFEAALEAGATPEQAMQAAFIAAGESGYVPTITGGGPEGGFGSSPFSQPGFGGYSPYGPSPYGNDFYFGGGDQFFGPGSDPYFNGGDPFFGPGDNLYFGEGEYFGDYGLYGPGDGIYDPFAFDPKYDVGEYTNIYDPLYENVTYAFDEHFAGTTGSDALVGTTKNTNFYFTHSALGGTDTVNDPGGSNQISFDQMQSMMIKLTIDSTSSNVGTFDIRTVTSGFNSSAFSSGTDATTISFHGITQYLFSDISLSTAYSSTYTALNPKGVTSTPESGDVLVFENMGTSEVGYAIAGTTTADTFTIDQTADGMLIFGRGGGDTFNIQNFGSIDTTDSNNHKVDSTDHILIGGIYQSTVSDGTGNNNDLKGVDNSTSGSDGIPDTNLNVFDYSGLNLTSFSLTLSGTSTVINDGTKGVMVHLDGEAGEPGGDAYLAENVTNAQTYSRINDLMWDVGSFIATTKIDAIEVVSGSYQKIDANGGNDGMTISGTAKIAYVYGGDGNDTIQVDTNLLGNSTLSSSSYGGITKMLYGGRADGTTDSSTSDTLVLNGGGTVSAAAMAVVSGFETITLKSDATYSITLNSGAQALTIGGSAVTSSSNTITLNGANVSTSALSMTGGAGNDTFTGGGGNDTLTAAGGNDTLTGGAGNDTFNVTVGTDTITDLGGASGGQSDVLVVNSGATANATLNGSFSATSSTANNGTAVITSASAAIGTINLNAATGSNGFTVNNASATGATTITGSTKGDTITASSHGDTITGGAGNDTLTGGSGADKFVFAATAALNGADTITSFTAGTDKIDLNGFETVGTVTSLTLGGSDANAAGEVFFLALNNVSYAGAADSIDGTRTAINAATTWTDTAATSILVISDDNSTAVYQWTGDGASNEATGDTFTLMATLDSAITSVNDIVIA
ncbi:FecR domain-containing protein [Magnetovibrio sp.]|uniref:FecR domain-containing protein n=1 Tax=Magnetovibrio sp. TaxID=2024836 RepID=UPI002F926EE1